MKISMMLDYSGDPRQVAAEARDPERAGLDVAQVAELYNFNPGVEPRLPGHAPS